MVWSKNFEFIAKDFILINGIPAMILNSQKIIKTQLSIIPALMNGN